MKAPIRVALLMLALVWPMACATFSPPSPPSTSTALGSTSTPARTSTPPESSSTPLATPTSGPKRTHGIFVVTSYNVAIRPATYANALVDGIVVRTFWSNVQPAPDQLDWSFLDSQVQAAAAGGKQVILVVLPGAGPIRASSTSSNTCARTAGRTPSPCHCRKGRGAGIDKSCVSV